MKVRLNKDAPWGEVTLTDGSKLNKVDWRNHEANVLPFLKYIEYELEKDELHYNIEKQELLNIANENNLNVNNLSTQGIIYVLRNKGIVISAPVVEQTATEKVDYSTYSKAELVKIATEKGINCTGLTKTIILEKLNA